MTKKQFRHDMRRGLGSCQLELRRCTDIEEYRQDILWGIQHALAYDAQCEGTRAIYFFDMIELFDDWSEFYTLIADSAKRNIKDLLTALRMGDLERFIQITESEAMQLHALMMCSEPSFILMKPNTLRIINNLHEFRKETDIPVCFTLDAGPNVHVLYPDQHAEMVERFIMDELEQYCFDGRWIPDQVGEGASRL